MSNFGLMIPIVRKGKINIIGLVLISVYFLINH